MPVQKRPPIANRDFCCFSLGKVAIKRGSATNVTDLVLFQPYWMQKICFLEKFIGYARSVGIMKANPQGKYL